MATYANERFFNHPSAVKLAVKGINSPKRRVISPNTMLFRYGNDMAMAKSGGWWLDLKQRNRVVDWATLHQLQVHHAMRIMCAVMHVWESADATKPPPTSTMEYTARAIVTKPLLAYEGESRPQTKHSGKMIEASIGPASLTPAMTQLFIPGLHDAAVCTDALDYISIITVEPGASAIFGGDHAITVIH